MTCSLLPQNGNRGLRQVDDAEQTGFDLRPKVSHADVLNRPNVPVAGIVDEHIKATESVERGRHGSVCCQPIVHIENDSANLFAVTLPKIFELRWIPRCGDEFVARCKHRFRERSAEAARICP
jgi:hypothetical protein